ncbi:unnamed protein product [Lactuca virosa]|uniref:Uncharacterized protein n=1 Tax=Lactuca virosa TaxID=75947 RepID=A0AAU9N2F7_9ASTR|nr:unnamed protein product [Lactuca virosa]
MQDVERLRAVVEPSRPASIDHVSVDISVESSRNKFGGNVFVDYYSKEGVLPTVNKGKIVWQSVGNRDVENLAMVCHLHPQKLARGVSHVMDVQIEVIDISNDGNVDKRVVPKRDMGVDCVGFEPGVVSETFDRVKVEGGGNNVKRVLKS